jgi:hypothetical protein
VTRCDGQGLNRGHGSGSRASPGGRPGAALPRVRGPLYQADRRPSRSIVLDCQGVLLRPDRGDSTTGSLRLFRDAETALQNYREARDAGTALKSRLDSGTKAAKDTLTALEARRKATRERCTALAADITSRAKLVKLRQIPEHGRTGRVRWRRRCSSPSTRLPIGRCRPGDGRRVRHRD